MKSRKLLSLLLASVFAISLILVSPTKTVNAAAISISKDVYYDKALGGLLGHVAGLLSGYEFVGGQDPTVGLPDAWFSLCYGPYGGATDMHGSAGVNRVVADGQIKSDDDYHIDIFNQHILDANGPDVTNQEIRNEWVEHQVSDWGGGYKAMWIMNNNSSILPPDTGKWEYGNMWHWCTEPYIENETLGMNAPGMPMTADALAEQFASVTGDFDGVDWAKFWSVAYSIAFFESDSATVLTKAVEILPKNSWSYSIYQECLDLYSQNSTDWRWACSQLETLRHPLFDQNDVNCSPDVNNGFAIIALLYGGNDYTNTCKIASLAGYDGDCTAAAVTGLMGIIKGFSGTPQVVKDRIYANGTGVYINDYNFDPHIGSNYPDQQLWTDIVSLYQSNAEDQIVANGGAVTSTTYIIVQEDIVSPSVVLINNYDFELGNITNWNCWQNGTTGNFYAENNGTANSGYYKGTLWTGDGDNTAAYISLSNLTQGATYKVSAYIQCQDRAEARLYADNWGGYAYKSINSVDDGWYYREVTFTTTGTTANIGLQVFGTSHWGCIDDIKVEKVTSTEQEIAVTNASFEADGAATQTPSSWSTWAGSQGTDADADYVETGSYAGDYRLTHYKSGAYEVYSSTTVTGLQNGTYKVGAWTVSGGGFNSNFISAKGYNSSNTETSASIPGNGWPNWTYVETSTFTVENGQVTIGFYSNASSGQWSSIDAVKLIKVN
jgi:hypothetical protein